MKWKKGFGKSLKEERLSWGMSRIKLAKLSNTDVETIEDIEDGKNLNPSFYDLLNICDVLDLSVYHYIDEKK